MVCVDSELPRWTPRAHVEVWHSTPIPNFLLCFPRAPSMEQCFFHSIPAEVLAVNELLRRRCLHRKFARQKGGNAFLATTLVISADTQD